MKRVLLNRAGRIWNMEGIPAPSSKITRSKYGYSLRAKISSSEYYVC
jgi:hypothetical protein